MKFRGLSKNLSDELENLFATLGEGAAPEDAQRLDQGPCIKDILERIKNLDEHSPNTDKNAQ